MNFSNYSKIFKNLRNLSSSKIVIELANEITGLDLDFFKDKNDDAISRYYTGGTKFTKLAKEIKPYINEENFQEYLEDYFSDNYNDLITYFKEFCVTINNNNWKEDITKLFIQIIDDAIGINIKTTSTKNELGLISKIVIDSTEGSLEESSKLINKDLNNSIKALEAIEKSKLATELQSYYDVKITRPDNEIIHSIIPKNEEAIKKFPFNIDIGFNTSNHTIEEIEKLNDLKSIIKEVNLKNKPYSIGTPSYYKEKIRKYDNPFPKIKNTLGLEMYLLPNPNVKVVNWSITLKNKQLDLKLHNINFHLLVDEENELTFSNIRNKNDKFVLEITFSWETKNDGKSYIHTNYQFHIKEEYFTDVDINKTLFKWQNIANDASSKIEIYSNDIKKIIISANGVGKTKYTFQSYNKAKSIIAHYERLQYIENELYQKFNIEYPRFYDEFNAIDMVYYSLKGIDKEITGDLRFDIELTETFEDIKVGDVLHKMKCGLRNVNIFNNIIELINTLVFFEKVTVSNIEYIDNIQKIYFQAKTVKLIMNE